MVEQKFLEKAAEYIYKKEQGRLEKIKLILPGKRTILFFKRAISNLVQEDSFLPSMYGIEEWIESQSSYVIPDGIRLNLELYHSYKKVKGENAESLDAFLRWGGLLLQDFNDADRCLSPSDKLFEYLQNLSDLDTWSDQLGGEEEDVLVKHRTFWDIMNRLYKQFKIDLSDKGLGFSGMVFRDVADRIDEIESQLDSDTHYYFIGFNALSPAEEKIIKTLCEKGKADTLWDIDQLLLEDKRQEAGLFIRKYKGNWNYFSKEPFKWKGHFFDQNQYNLQIVSTSKTINQVEAASLQLEKWLSEGKKMEDTAVVLCDESMLLPFLYRLPDQLKTANITMGYPMNLLPISGFVEDFFQIYIKAERFKRQQKKSGLVYYFYDLRKWFSQHFTKILLEGKTELLLEISKENKQIMTGSSYWLKVLKDNELNNLGYLFPENIDTGSFIAIFNRSLEIIRKTLAKDDEKYWLELEYLYGLTRIFKQLEIMNEQYPNLIQNIALLKQFVNQMIRKEKLDFYGEPLVGMQIMGMLETRLLDFKQIIICGLNEGIMPAGKNETSLIPFEVKKSFNMTTFQEKDAIYAYHFFRLMQRAQDVCLIYDSQPDSKGNGTPSRFILQLENEWKEKYPERFKVSRESFSPILKENRKQEKQFHRNDKVQEALNKYAARGVSPSALINFINCPLEFYYQKVLGVYFDDDLTEIAEANTLGTVVHKCLEELYLPLKGRVLKVADINHCRKQIKPNIARIFKEEFPQGNLGKGRNLVSLEMAADIVDRFLKLEIQQLKDFEKKGEYVTILETEMELMKEIVVPGIPFPVKLKGFADRVDRVGDRIRIIDYKSGKVSSTELSLPNMEALLRKDKGKALQLLMYSYLYQDQLQGTDSIHPGIFSFQNLSAGLLELKPSKREFGDKDLMEEFEEFLFDLLRDMLLEREVFEHANEDEKCYFCNRF